MDNNELDKILKNKLKSTIMPSKELEDKIKAKIEEQKSEIKSLEVKKSEPDRKISYLKISRLISVAAVFVIIFTLGLFFGQNEETPTSPYINEKESKKLVTIKAIRPTKVESGIIAKDSEFLINVEEEDSDIESVQRSLYIEPALDYNIEKIGTNEYKLKFKQNIPDNIILKLQYVKNQITEDSWAYQSSTDLSVTKTFPNNNSTNVSKDTTIEIELSYASVKNFEENISINPNVSGTWEHIGKIWRFSPNSQLNDGEYRVKLSKNISAENQNMKEDFEFKFTVGNESTFYSKDNITIDKINTFSAEEQIKIMYTRYRNSVNIGKVVINKFENADDFIEYANNGIYEKATNIGEYEFENQSMTEEEKLLILKKNLPIGYYVASIQASNGKELFNAGIQINDIQSYVMETERDIIVWTAQNGELAQDIEVSYLDKKIKTNSNGMAILKDITDGSNKMKFVKIGNNENKLVVGVNNFSQNNYPSGFLYTDRPLYKNTDTINIWGFVPRSLFKGEIDEDAFYIEFDNIKKKVKVDENGNINCKIELNNYRDVSENVGLLYKNYWLASKQIEVKNYGLQNYNYEIIMDKNWAYSGEEFDINVKVTHVTGILVQGKNVSIKYNEKTINAKTDEKGIAHATFTAKTTNNSNESTVSYDEIFVYNGDSEEYTNVITRLDFNIIPKDAYTEKSYNKYDEKYNITLYKLLKDKKEKIEKIENLYDGTYDTEVEITLKETLSHRYIKSYIFNEYSKKNEPMYEWNLKENTTKIKTINTVNGKITIDRNELNLKNNTENDLYTYTMIISYKDRSGNLVEDKLYISNEVNGILGHLNNNNNMYEIRYGVYRYFLELNKKTDNPFSIYAISSEYAIGEKINIKLKESTTSGEKEIANQGKILRILYKNDIIDTKIIKNDDLDFTYSENYFPNVNMTAAYFLNGKFYRMPTYYIKSDEEEKNIDIEIKTDKDKYEPGDKVTLTVKTTSNGKNVKALVNISVANEAVFNIASDDDIKIKEAICSSSYFPNYTFSSYMDQLDKLSEASGGGGGGDKVRANFGDTAYFNTINTNSEGIATVTFTLPDNVTTYRITAHAANNELYLGEKTSKIISTLDFFIQHIEPRGIKASDDVVLVATGISEKEEMISYEFNIEELNKTLEVSQDTNKMASVNFGKLPVGKYHVSIKGTNGIDTDTVKYEFEVVESMQEVSEKTTLSINESVQINPSKNPIKLEIYNKKMEQYIKYIDFIEKTYSSRLDTKVAYNEVQKIKNKYYGTNYSANDINIQIYKSNNNRYKNLENGVEDLVLTALMKYYSEYSSNVSLEKTDNLYEYYLYKAAEGETVLEDLKYLSEDKDIDNYNKLLLTLSFIFVGDYQSAKQEYADVIQNISDEQKQEYASLIAIIDTFENKSKVISEINDLIENKPADEYLRFAILSFFKNNAVDISTEETVTIRGININEKITLNGMEIKTLTVYDQDLSSISFETTSQDLMVSYYYQTSLEDVNNDKIVKDINIELKGKITKDNEVELVINFSKLKNQEGEIKIALPNSLRLAQNYDSFLNDYYKNYYIEKNSIDNITLYKQKGCSTVKIPLIVTLDGEFKFENVVFTTGDGIYHISNSLNGDR